MRKKILGTIIILLTAILIPLKAYAAGGFSVSTQEITLYPGESASFTVTASNSVGKIDLLSSDTNIATLNTDAVFLDLDSVEITVTANEVVGSTEVTVTASDNFATYDEEILGDQSYIIAVNVVEKTQSDDNNQITDIFDNQSGQSDNKTPNTANAPDTGDSQHINDGASQIILSSIIGISFTVVSFIVVYVYRRVKTR